MKTPMYLIVMAVLVIAGCAKEETLSENSDFLELKRAKVPIPMKADCFAVPDPEADPIPISGLPGYYYPGRLLFGGTCTHVGIIDAEKSYYKFEKCEFTPENGIPYSTQSGVGILVAGNGDSFAFTWWVKQSLVDGNYTGEMDITSGSGTGKFKGASGSGNTVGGWNMDRTGVWYTVKGFMVFE